MIGRRNLLSLAGAAALVPTGMIAQTDAISVAQQMLIFGSQQDRDDALSVIAEQGTPDMVASLLLAMRFSRGPTQGFIETLEAVTGAQAGNDWNSWMLWQEGHPDIVPHAGYADLKREIFVRIDPNFADFLNPEYTQREKMNIRLEEIVWGGVRKDGIPSLDSPTLLSANKAGYLRDDDLVFGVAINGDVRAYPLRIMGWHEMFNEVIGGVPVALAYCTLCGAGILFETDVAGRSEPFVFGSSGFLYRSNKLMFDRETNTLWNQFTGKPVAGPLADSGIELQQRPVTITSWKLWREANPGTTVLARNTGYRRDYGSGVVYNDYFASDELMFPVVVDESQYKQKSYVFGIRVFGDAKAWPLKFFADTPVINDEIAGRPVVLIGNAATRTVRAYERGNREFQLEHELLSSDDGGVWQIGEDALSNGTENLARLPGHIAYWFAWNNYLGLESDIYDG